ncbi:MAG: hypothetical protein ABDH28_07470 [Brevinematia bacterium]
MFSKVFKPVKYGDKEWDIVELVEKLYSQGLTDSAVASVLGFSTKHWYDILSQGKKGLKKTKYLKRYMEIYQAKERGLGKHQADIIARIQRIISKPDYDNEEFLLKYLKSRYSDEFKVDENKIIVEFVRARIKDED